LCIVWLYVLSAAFALHVNRLQQQTTHWQEEFNSHMWASSPDGTYAPFSITKCSIQNSCFVALLPPVVAIRGGGMWTAGGGVVTLRSSSMNSNTAQSLGGGLLATGASTVGGKPVVVWDGLASQPGPCSVVLHPLMRQDIQTPSGCQRTMRICQMTNAISDSS
jgi:hypothetical protein